jgi:hypothetical protein
MHREEGIRVRDGGAAGRISARVAILAIAVVGSFSAPSAIAAAPYCGMAGTQGYCQYQGKVSQAYVNAYQEILLYFDAPVPASEVAVAGFTGVSNFGAARFHMAGNPDFGKMLYASLLAAQARGATVTVQMYSSGGGYLQIDRIWVSE